MSDHVKYLRYAAWLLKGFYVSIKNVAGINFHCITTNRFIELFSVFCKPKAFDAILVKIGKPREYSEICYENRQDLCFLCTLQEEHSLLTDENLIVLGTENAD